MSQIDRDAMIEEMIESIDSWDLDTLICFAQDTLVDAFKSLSDQDLIEQYNNMLGVDYEPIDDYYSDEEEIEEDTFPAVEECPNCGKEKDIGQKCWWCGVCT